MWATLSGLLGVFLTGGVNLISDQEQKLVRKSSTEDHQGRNFLFIYF